MFDGPWAVKIGKILDKVFNSLSLSIVDFDSYVRSTKRVWMVIRKKSNSIFFSRNNENPNFREIPFFIKQDLNQRFVIILIM